MAEERAVRGRDERLALVALGAVLLITVGWWSLALWPVRGDPPPWLELARSVCFNAGPDGLPDASGWMMLVGQPLGMFGFLLVVWPRSVVGGVRSLAASGGGRLLLAAVVLGCGAGLGAVGVRVTAAAEAREAAVALPPDPDPGAALRLEREPPPLALVDQHGRDFTLAEAAGRPVLVTFAFGHCQDICPLVVRNALEARERVWGSEGAVVVVVTLDPWRDTPSRLPDLARRWGLGEEDRVLGGPVEQVEGVLNAWEVPRHRDLRTGDVAHPPVVHLLDPEGRIAFTSLGGTEALVTLGERLRDGR